MATHARTHARTPTLLLLAQSGDPACTLSLRGADTVAQVKAAVERRTGRAAAALALCLPSEAEPLGDHRTLVSCGLPAELCAVVLQRVDVAEVVGVPAHQLTDHELARACAMPTVRGGDVVSIRGARNLVDASALGTLAQVQTLDLAGCYRLDARSVADAITKLE